METSDLSLGMNSELLDLAGFDLWSHHSGSGSSSTPDWASQQSTNASASFQVPTFDITGVPTTASNTIASLMETRATRSPPISRPTASGSFTCQQCKGHRPSFTSQGRLRRHQKQSHEKPFTCTFGTCNMRFGARLDLKRHMATHNGEKLFQCPLCQKSFSRMDNLKRHKQSQHGKRIHPDQKGRW
ncbi:hypothetical protein B0H63DRAFT_64717 [Podospora didyma]|uniref:C2H2-type domain-containing protein n=1 Tax=Podospora didyma TaxID=330526 RepID=A0AAE0P8A8_9PEZI|nr:hypothetical protein B0H63DRAFT_64717 [Podospora didyma]